MSAPVDTASTRKIKFLSRTLPFPTDPSFREFRMIEDLTGVAADQIMLGTAGVWMLPALAIVALMRSNAQVTRNDLAKILDLSPTDITLEGFKDEDSSEGEEDAVVTTATPLTGTESTPEIPVSSGTQVSLTTSPEQPESQTT